MRMHIDKPGCHERAIRVDLARSALLDAPDVDNHTVVDRDIGSARWCAGSIHDVSAPDHKLGRHRAIVREARRTVLVRSSPVGIKKRARTAAVRRDSQQVPKYRAFDVRQYTSRARARL